MPMEPSNHGKMDREIAGLSERELLQAKRPGTGLTDTEPLSFDPKQLRQGRLERLRAMLRERELAGCLLFEPYNQRYATGSRNMFGYFLRNSTRYFFVAAEGPVILFEYPQSSHVSEVLETVDEARTSKVVWSSVRGRDRDTAKPFAQEIASLVREHGGGCKRIGIDRCFHSLALALEDEGLEVDDCNQDILKVRSVKTPEEITCLKLSMITTEAAVYDVMQSIRPGITEQDLFAEMYRSVISGGAEFIETRLLSSGPRTNPWFNEASTKRVRPGELVALDTDTVGNFGYYSDFSRTFHCGPGKPTGAQKTLYQMAHDQVQHNVELLKPGMELREVADKAWKIPDRYVDRRYTSVMHGCGMHGESPFIAHAMDWDRFGGDGVLEPNMVLCIESYIGEVGGAEGVKLEEEVVLTEQGAERISQFPFDETLLG
jgi:Xaa-Pro aminopeptidase